MQVELAGLVTVESPAKVGASVHAPVAMALTSEEAGEVQAPPSFDLTV